MAKRIIAAAVASAGVVSAIAPIVAAAPAPALNLPNDIRTAEEAIVDCLDSGYDGWDLVDYAAKLVNRKFTRYSVWHLWEPAALAFKHSRGFSDQYNRVLKSVLAALGFDAWLVRCEDVTFTPGRDDPGPDALCGHTWVQVAYDGEIRDVCASRHHNEPGKVAFSVHGEVEPVGWCSGVKVRARLAVPVAFEVWKALMTRTHVPRWLFRGFHDHG